VTATILFAGGGTGGHIYPNVAIVERLAERAPHLRPHFLVSARPGDAATMKKLGYAFTPSPVLPLPSPKKPWRAVPFLLAWRRAIAEARELLERERIAAVVATGGFVSGPGIIAAKKAGLPRALVNLDAIPGKANRRLARECPRIFSAYESEDLPGAARIGLPLRAASTSTLSPSDARRALDLGLRPELPLLLVTGATHGAESIIKLMIAWVQSAARGGLVGWQVLHQCGTWDPAALQKVYDDAGVPARVVAYLDAMGLAWRAADLAVARAGAGSVAEAWANATPTIFLPNPYHHDEHQRHNAAPMADAGGARIVKDRIDAQANLEQVVPVIADLLAEHDARDAMRTAAERTRPPDGAREVADWIADVAGDRA
jgi:UDP-N-acetylglucosamine--N-acetylmuramyl-(pentapeptide) pyrophosphoryl-undecaprenol N-acetylglucosamine transferase